MALSAINYVGDGVSVDFPATFTLGYLEEAHIKVFVDEVEDTNFTIELAGTVVRFPVAPAVAATILIRRITPNDVLIHDYDEGALIIEENLDQSNLQSIMLMHEAIDGFTAQGAGSILDMGGLRIINLGSAVDGTDAMNFDDSLTAVTAAELAETNSAASAVASQASLDTFNSVFLGNLASDPGGATIGQWYFNTTAFESRLYNGTIWEQLFFNTLLDTQVQGLDVKVQNLEGLNSILINGNEFINQRVVANWAAVTIGQYGFDRWRKIDASTKRQPIEDGSYLYSTVYTLDANGMTAVQITSPASGNWDNTDLDVPIAATDMTLGLGVNAVPFVPEPVSTNLAKCLRYFERTDVGIVDEYSQNLVPGSTAGRQIITWAVPKRVVPTFTFFNFSASLAGLGLVLTTRGAKLTYLLTFHRTGEWLADAEIY